MTKDKSIFIKNIYYMLAYAFSALSKGEFDDIAKEKFDNIHNLFAAILSTGISCRLKQGLYREYVNKTESLTTVRGKIDISGTIRNRIARKSAVSCEYDELSVNNVMNRIIKKAVMILLKRPDSDVDKKYKDSLKRDMRFFSEVDDIDPRKIRWQTVRFEKNNSSYRLLVGISRMVIEGMLMTTEKGEYRLEKFLSDQYMSRLYEKFILEFYRKECKTLTANPSQINWALDIGSDGENLPQMRSDITLADKETGNILIIDAKYYTHEMQEYYGVQTIHSGNLYQIFAYVKNKAAEIKSAPKTISGMLLYAQTESGAPMNREYMMSGNKISVKTLDLNREFSEIAEQLKLLAREHFGESCAE